MNFVRVSSLWIAAGGYFGSWIAYILADVQPDPRVCLAVALEVFAVYSLSKLTDIEDLFTMFTILTTADFLTALV
jgi:hypothetical protein